MLNEEKSVLCPILNSWCSETPPAFGPCVDTWFPGRDFDVVGGRVPCWPRCRWPRCLSFLLDTGGAEAAYTSKSSGPMADPHRGPYGGCTTGDTIRGFLGHWVHPTEHADIDDQTSEFR